jgi:GNAT superfamily N-acetyltransferase
VVQRRRTPHRYNCMIPTAKESDVARLGHLNLLEYCRESARWARGGQILESAGVLFCAGGTWIPVNFNTAWRTLPSVSGEEMLTRADRFFGSFGVGYTVRLRELNGVDDDVKKACLDRGIEPFDEAAPEMVCDHHIFAPTPENVVIGRIESGRDVAELAAITGAAYATYGLPEGEAQLAFGSEQAVLDAPHVYGLIARSDGYPVSAALGLLSHGIGGVYWVGTVPIARGKGLGAALAAAVTNLGLDAGASVMTLQASVMGRPIYERLGYRTLFHYQNYVRWSVPSLDDFSRA